MCCFEEKCIDVTSNFQFEECFRRVSGNPFESSLTRLVTMLNFGKVRTRDVNFEPTCPAPGSKSGPAGLLQGLT